MRVLLALDSDEAGQRATLSHAESIADFTTSWGTPRGGGPTAQSLAVYQNERDRLVAYWAAMDEGYRVTGCETLKNERDDADFMLETLGSLITDSYKALFRDRDYERCESAEEWQEFMRPKPKEPYQAGRIDFEAIKNRIDIVDWVSQFTDLVQRGATFKGTCPLPSHEEKTPSFFVYPENDNWYCFGCNQWGDVFDIAKALNINVRDL